ncbi:receptor kinase-like protein Xa21 [Phragmites australis]|uniref:receptor kinase-like protein Xa21 n=1 Tax=Phragmites australis TaxID=29695 RepID=UPI002D78458F|nr:receptor kinase-like protein Xa21 [Phragmites australis]
MRRQVCSCSLLMAEAITVFCLSLLFFCSHALVSPGSSNATTDELSLLAFKSMLSSPSDGLLASWNTSSHYCSWPGVVCSRRQPERVISLLMGSFNLSGRLSPFLGNLSFLKKLDLHDNQFVGHIPPELGHLSRLRMLNLSTNTLHGSIPVALGGCTNLTMLDLSSNQLRGEIPTEVGALKNLVDLRLHKNGLSGVIPVSLADSLSIEYLSLRNNRLSGEIPLALGNLTNLWHLDLADNMLSGAIPSSLGWLSSLSVFNLGYNNLSGLIPTSLWNISSLTVFAVQQNMLSGTIPPNAFSTLHHLQKIAMNGNEFHGYIPSSLANASDLSFVQLNYNFLSGIVPPEVEMLRQINWLQLSNNLLQAKEPKDWDFISALTNCSQLQMLDLGANKFRGVLPDSVSNLSNSLTFLSFSVNEVSGSIPKDIGNIINLQSLDLSNNYFTGNLPSSLSRLKNLQAFSVYSNKISGSIPLSIGNLTKLNYLDFDTNAFSGRIPNTLGNMTNLLALGLSNNNFTGQIPIEIFNIPTLSGILELSNNNLEGSIPQEIGNLKNLVEFRADSNKLSGEIPRTLGECQLLQNLYLQNNILTGRIPSLLSQLKGLENLDLSSNNLSGQIPKFFGNISTLYYLNLSFNNFIGQIPSFGVFANASAISIQGNDKLCGGIPDLHLTPCSSELGKRKHKFPLIPIAVSLTATIVILSLICIFLSWRKSTTKVPSTTSMQGHQLITYPQLVRATDGFSSSNLLGSGTFGAVFKGNIGAQDGQSTSLIAVKVLKLQTPGALKSFTAECEALRNLRHRNLVKIITACCSIDSRGNDFKAIVFEFMPNGSLEGWLHPDTNDQTEQKYLNLLERVTILLDVVNALDYLHCHGPAPVVHCDLKSSNVLLDADMAAHVGDFGLAKILVEGSTSFHQSTSSMGFRGTIGYAAPEYGAGNTVSTNGDIYSYGILVLETITGKRPTDSGFRQGSNLREYVELGLLNGVMDVVDIRLSSDLENRLQSTNDSSYRRQIDCLVSLLRLGMSCSEEMPSSRMPTGDIIRELQAIKEYICRGENKT